LKRPDSPVATAPSLGVITSIVEMGLVEPKEPITEVKLDFPLGRVTGYAHTKDGVVEYVTARLSYGGFLQELFMIDLPKIGSVPIDIGFAGRYFAFMHSADIGVKVKLENVPRLVTIASATEPLIKAKVKELGIEHPDWPGITWLNNIIVEDEPTLREADHKNATLSPPSHHFDRSPCGSGTCANMGVLYSKGKLGLNQKWVNENLMGTATFTGRLVSKTKVGHHDAVIPEYTGSAYITAIATVIVDPRDPFKHGFKELRDPGLAKIFHGWF
jgi:proline racemase/trans-L-3-hydroxyproline dehydratase